MRMESRLITHVKFFKIEENEKTYNYQDDFS